MKFVFSPAEDIIRYPQDYMGSYGYENDEYKLFHEEVIESKGKEIMSMKKTCTGYYDIVFESMILFV